MIQRSLPRFRTLVAILIVGVGASSLSIGVSSASARQMVFVGHFAGVPQSKVRVTVGSRGGEPRAILSVRGLPVICEGDTAETLVDIRKGAISTVAGRHLFSDGLTATDELLNLTVFSGTLSRDRRRLDGYIRSLEVDRGGSESRYCVTFDKAEFRLRRR